MTETSYLSAVPDLEKRQILKILHCPDLVDVWQIYDFVRAQTHPYPGAFAWIGDKWVRIWRCRVFDVRIRYDNAGYGDCVERFGERLLVKCCGGLLLLDDYEILARDPTVG